MNQLTYIYIVCVYVCARAKVNYIRIIGKGREKMPLPAPRKSYHDVE